ncbi:MAG TPA: YbhB/YbcL family Raf kinase inhibitor-like protein [Candidatus Sabulitectum sp.]|nr:YbhB/YbcL family Raf kinase inhibitor-like protein [Candidatus Sabulitectum sp.]
MMEFKLCSSAFCQGDHLPAWYCGAGLNASPPFGWDGEPEGTVSLALICRSSAGNVHWVMWNIPNTLKTIYGKQPSEGKLSDGIIQGVNDFGDTGWTGPEGRKEGMSLTLTLYALDSRLGLSDPAANAERLMASMKGHILKEASLTCECS